MVVVVVVVRRVALVGRGLALRVGREVRGFLVVAGEGGSGVCSRLGGELLLLPRLRLVRDRVRGR